MMRITLTSVFLILPTLLTANELSLEERVAKLEEEVRRLGGMIAQEQMEAKRSPAKEDVTAESTVEEKTEESSTPKEAAEPKGTPDVEAEEAELEDPVAALIAQQKKDNPKSTTVGDTLIPNGDDYTAYTNARSSLKQGQTYKAINELNSFLEAYPNSLLGPNGAFWLGEAYNLAGDKSQAAVAYGRAYSLSKALLEKPENKPHQSTIQAQVPASMVKLSEILIDTGKKDQAKATMKALKAEFPMMPYKLKKRQEALLQRASSR